MYLVEVIQGHIIARLHKVLLLVIGNLRPGDGYPEVREKDLCLLDELTLYCDSYHHHSCYLSAKNISLGVIEYNYLEHCRCSIAKNRHSCTRVCRPSTAGEYAEWTWPDHNCASEEILGAEERRKMVRALAYRAGVVKMSGSAFSIVATEILHHMAVIVSYAYDTFVSNSPFADQSEDIPLEKRIQRGLNYFANFHPPGQTELVVIPRQIRDAAMMIGMKPLLGFGAFGAEWAASSDDGRDESSNDDEIDEEVKNAENQYYPAEEIESEDGRVGGDELVQDMVAAKRSNDAVTKEIPVLIKHGSESNNSARGNWNDIEQAQRVIRSFKADLEEHKSKRQKVLDMGMDKTGKKITKLDEKIKATRRMIKISEGELARQMKEIEGDDAGGFSSDNDSD